MGFEPMAFALPVQCSTNCLHILKLSITSTENEEWNQTCGFDSSVG